MDFGMVGLDSETSLASLTTTTTTTTSDPETKQQQQQQKWYGSGFLKQERSENNTGGGEDDVDDDDWRSLKVAKTDDFSVSKAMLLQQQQRNNHSSLRSNNSLFSDGQQHQHQHQQQQQQQQQMLSFSSPKSSEAFLHRNDTTGSTFPYYYPTQPPCNRSTGYNSGNLNAASMHGFLTGVRGPFTPSQWMELEHQALIYKYINANVPIPSNLLIPIKRALDSAGFSTFSGIPFRPNTLGWGSFHLGFSNNTDPEPGRCRRTDGKKWRCSRDAVADQKYCERHINRGRHRSRKPVEGQSGHSVAGTTTTTTTKPMSIASSSSASVVSGGGNSSGMPYSLAMTQQHQVKHLQPSASDTSAAAQINKIYMNKENMGEGMLDTPVLSMLSSTTNLNSKDSSFSIPKQRMPYEESSRPEFGFVSSDCLLNPSKKSFTFMNCKNYNSSKELTDREAESQHPLRPFMDDWPKNQSERSTTISWPDMGMQSDRTQLSISIPMAPSDFMSSTSSPTNEKPALSPLRLSRELDQIQMGLGVGNVSNEQNHRQANWIPISWETSVGGPLGEVLHNTNSNKVDYKNPSALNLMTEGWDNSPRLGSSPTGVLQKTTFGSLSNSSAGSSPRAENNRTHEGSSFCNDPLGSTLVNSSSFPSL